jgi:hypothetical protein
MTRRNARGNQSGSRKGRLGTGRRDWLWGLALGALVVMGIVIALVALKPSNTKVYATVNGVDCERGERLEYHVHAWLAIMIEGEESPVPANLGIRPNECIFWLHTHDDSGVLHIEAPEKRDFTLGQFFSIWGVPLSTTQLLGKTVDASHQITATVNGAPFTGDPSTIVLADQQSIVLQYGPPFGTPPASPFH